MPGAAIGTKWLGTTMPALPNEHPPRCSPCCSIKVTWWPRRLHASATDKPMTPPPKIAMCLLMPLSP